MRTSAKHVLGSSHECVFNYGHLSQTEGGAAAVDTGAQNDQSVEKKRTFEEVFVGTQRHILLQGTP